MSSLNWANHCVDFLTPGSKAPVAVNVYMVSNPFAPAAALPAGVELVWSSSDLQVATVTADAL